jgi:hypothetical protein
MIIPYKQILVELSVHTIVGHVYDCHQELRRFSLSGDFYSDMLDLVFVLSQVRMGEVDMA